MVKVESVPDNFSHQIARNLAAESIQKAYRRFKECKPSVKLRRINSEEKLVQDIAADIIKGELKKRVGKFKQTSSGPPSDRPPIPSSPLTNTSTAATRAMITEGNLESGDSMSTIIARFIKIQSFNLTNPSFLGSQDPYIKISFKNWHGQTPVIENGGSNVTWDHLNIEVSIPTEELDAGAVAIVFDVRDKNESQPDKLIGKGNLVVRRPILNRETEFSVSLIDIKNKNAGSINIWMRFEKKFTTQIPNIIRYELGARVVAKFHNKEEWSPGNIARVCDHDLYDVRFHDGVVECNVKHESIRLVETNDNELKRGVRVEARYRGRDKWYPGVIENIKPNGNVDIDYDDGETEIDVPRKLVRILKNSPVNSPQRQATSADTGNSRISGWKVGDTAIVKYLNEKWHYHCKIISINPNGFYDVEYGGGVRESSVKVEDAQASGSHVLLAPADNATETGWLKVNKIVVSQLANVSSWSGKIDPYIKINQIRSGVAWNTSVESAKSGFIFDKMDNVLPMSVVTYPVTISLVFANRVRDDILFAMEVVPSSHFPHIYGNVATISLSYTMADGKSNKFRLDIHYERFYGSELPVVIETGIEQDHRKYTLDSLKISSNLVNVKSLINLTANPSKPETPKKKLTSKNSGYPQARPTDIIKPSELNKESRHGNEFSKKQNNSGNSNIEKVTKPLTSVSKTPVIIKSDLKKNIKPVEVIKIEQPAELLEDSEKVVRKKKAKQKRRASTDLETWISKNATINQNLIIDEAYKEALQSLLNSGLFLTFSEVSIILQAVGYSKACVPAQLHESRQYSFSQEILKEHPNIREGFISLALSPSTTPSEIAHTLTKLVHELDFGLVRKVSSEDSLVDQLDEGSKIEACYRGLGNWFSGIIVKNHHDGTFDITYDDGSTEIRVAKDVIRIAESKRMPNFDLISSFKINDKVEAKFKGGSKWFGAKVVEINDDGSYSVLYDDGDRDSHVPASDVRPVVFLKDKINDSIVDTEEALRVNDKVEAKFKGGSKWFGAKVVEVNQDSTYNLVYDDGDIENKVRRSSIRLVSKQSSVESQRVNTEQMLASDSAKFSSLTIKDGELIMQHLMSLAIGTWTRIRNFILLVCSAHPDQGGGRPCNWSADWVKKLAVKLQFPVDKFLSCNGIELLESNAKKSKMNYNIIPSLLQSRFSVYQHILRLIDQWWDIPCRPDDKISPEIVLPKRISALYTKKRSPPEKPKVKTIVDPDSLIKKKQFYRATLSPQYLPVEEEDIANIEAQAVKFTPGTSVAVAPKFLLYPVMLNCIQQHELQISSENLENFCNLIGGRNVNVVTCPYGHQNFRDMQWISLMATDASFENVSISNVVKELESVTPDSMVSGRQVLVPQTCLFQGQLDENLLNMDHSVNEIKTPSAHANGFKDPFKSSTPFPLLSDTDWRDDYSEDSDAPRGDEEYPPDPSTYIGGGKGAKGAIVTAPLPEALPVRKARMISPPHSKKKSTKKQSPRKIDDNDISSNPSIHRDLYRPVLMNYDTVVTDDIFLRDLKNSHAWIKNIGLNTHASNQPNVSESVKDSVKASLLRFEKMEKQFQSGLPEYIYRKEEYDPLKEKRRPMSAPRRPQSSENKNRPESASSKRKKGEAIEKQRFNERFKAVVAKDDAIRKFIRALENVHNVDEIESIRNNLPGGNTSNRKSKEQNPLFEYDPGKPSLRQYTPIIGSMIKYKLNHDIDSSSMKKKLQRWGISPSRPRSADNKKLINTDVTDASEEVKQVSPQKKKIKFPWMVGDGKVSDNIDPKKHERLWRALKQAERETMKKESHLRKELQKMGVSELQSPILDPYETLL